MANGHGHDSHRRRRQDKDSSSPTASDMSMMRVAVAGTGGLARLIAHYIDEDTSHHVVFLSRTEQQQLTTQGYQVAVVDYNNRASLHFALRGIDTVISTVTGPNQLELIEAAVSARVRRFALAEFEGIPELRTANDPLDRRRTEARQWLARHSQSIQSTAFVCGILFERFQPGGLRALRMGLSSGLEEEGDYIMNCRNMSAIVPVYDANGAPDVRICITAAQDVARFVTRALDLPSWPSELRMCGHRIKVSDLILGVRQLTGRNFEPIYWHTHESLFQELSVATYQNNPRRLIMLRSLLSTAQGHYDFTQPNLNQLFPDITTLDFMTWFRAKWDLQQ